jgi:cation diffusion facilitator CzcD-associated flavoprotein CzcO
MPSAGNESTDARVAPVPALIVGAGPAGLAAAACLKQRGIDALVLDAGTAVGASWRQRYDRLHLHTVKQHSFLPGMRFAKDIPRYPSAAQMVAYLEAYAAGFAIQPRFDEPVRRVSVAGDGFVVETARAVHRARAVVMATGYNRVPNPDRPPGAERYQGQLLHAASYRNGEPFVGKHVLVVGAGNTGAEIALELAERGAKPTLAVRNPVNVVPREFLGLPTQVTSIRMRRAPIALGDSLGRLISRLVFGNLARFGFGRPELGPLSAIKLRRRIPLIDIGTIAAIKAGRIAVKPAVDHFTPQGAAFADSSAGEYHAIVLATGYRAALAEIVDVPGVLAADGHPLDWQGGGACRNLFFVGFHNVATGLLREIGIEAQAVAAAIAAPA